jgi:hypothetical protein
VVRQILLITLFCALALGPPAAAADLDPVVADVVRMLDEGVDTQFISAWLDRTEVNPGTLTPDDLIALSKADAPKEIVNKLLKMAPEGEKPAREPAATAPPAAAQADTIVQFVIDYRPGIIEDQSYPWDLFVYLDGEPLSRTSGWASHSSTHMEKQFVERKLAPGRHEIRLLQEQHRVKSKKKGTWSHMARVFPTTVLFDIDSAGTWRVEIQVDEEGMLHPGRKSPVNYIVTRDGDIAEQGVDLGPATRQWPLLCEEVASRYPGTKLQSRSAQRAMSGCVRWNSLWTEMESVPDRATVREKMKAGNFRVAQPG